MISNATEEAQRILREAKEYADQTMRDFQKFGKENVSVREMEQKRTALREKMNKLDKKRRRKCRSAPEISARRIFISAMPSKS